MFYSTKASHAAKALFPNRTNHPYFTPFGEEKRITREQQQANLFADMEAAKRRREFNAAVIARGGRVLPALNK